MPLLKIRNDLDAPPTFDEYQGALGKLKLRKSGGECGVTPEMLVFGSLVLHNVLLELFRGYGVRARCLLPGGIPWLFLFPRKVT